VQNGHEIAPRASIHMTLVPETGTPVSADFTTPATYGSDTTITLV
jgi:archaellin